MNDVDTEFLTLCREEIRRHGEARGFRSTLIRQLMHTFDQLSILMPNAAHWMGHKYVRTMSAYLQQPHLTSPTIRNRAAHAEKVIAILFSSGAIQSQAMLLYGENIREFPRRTGALLPVEADNDVASIAAPLSVLIRDHGMSIAGLVAAHWWNEAPLALGSTSTRFPTEQRPAVAFALITLAPRTSPFFEALCGEIDTVDGPSWIIDAVFDAQADSRHSLKLSSISQAMAATENAGSDVESTTQFLRVWRRKVRRRFLGSCLDWIEL